MGGFEHTERAMALIDFQLFDPLLSDAEAEGMLRLCERFGRYGTYSEEAIEDDFAGELAQRYDAAFNFVSHRRPLRTQGFDREARRPHQLFPRDATPTTRRWCRASSPS